MTLDIPLPGIVDPDGELTGFTATWTLHDASDDADLIVGMPNNFAISGSNLVITADKWNISFRDQLYGQLNVYLKAVFDDPASTELTVAFMIDF